MPATTSFEDPRLRLLICRYVRLAPGEWDYAEGSPAEHRFVSLPYWRLYWNAQPGAIIRHAGRTLDLKPSVVAMVSPHTVFSTANPAAVHHFHVHFQIPAFYHNVPPQVTALAATVPIRRLIAEAIRLLHRPAPPPWRLSLAVRALVEIALSKLMEGTAPIPRLDARVLAALAYLDEHPGADLSNRSLARQAGMSVGAFGRIFRSQVGRSVHQHVRLKCLETACALLLSDASIKEVAAATGFCDRYHFSRIFKRVHGIGPAEFRRTHQPPFSHASRSPQTAAEDGMT